MTVDEKIKARAQREGSPVPDGFDERMDALMRDLPAQTAPVAPVRKRRASRTAVCIGIAAALVVGAAAAAPTVIQMAQGAIDYFHTGRAGEYTALQTEYEQFNASVGASKTVDGVTLTINNIALDDSYMSIFFTMSSDTPLDQVGTNSEPESWRAGWTAPVFWAKVNGKELDTTGEVQNEAYFVDDYTLKGVHRLTLKETLPEQFDLLLYTSGTSRLNEGDIQFELSVDKSAVAVETRTVEPEQDFTVDYVHTYEDGSTNAIHRTPRIERLSISPLSATITLSEKVSGDDFPWDGFVLRDDKGNFLLRLPAGMTSSTLGRSVNVFEFIGADETTKSVTLIPIKWSYHAHEVKGALDSLPLTDDCKNGVTLETLEVGADKAVATFSVRGAVWEENGQFNLTDADGNALSFNKFAAIESYTDRETGKIIATLYYPDATEEEVSKIAGVSFWQPDDDLELLEDQAVTIDLP